MVNPSCRRCGWTGYDPCMQVSLAVYRLSRKANPIHALVLDANSRKMLFQIATNRVHCPSLSLSFLTTMQTRYHMILQEHGLASNFHKAWSFACFSTQTPLPFWLPHSAG